MEDKEKDMEQWNDVKDKKGGKGIIIVIILLLVIILILGGILFINKNAIFGTQNTNKDANTTEKTDVDEDITFTESELEKYVNYICPIGIGPSPKLYDESIISADSMSARDKIEYLGSILFEKQKYTDDNRYGTLEEDVVKKQVEEVYGPDTYERTVFNLNCGDYVFRENEGKYYSQTGCGGTTVVLVQNMVIDYTATKDKLEITTSYAFFDGEKNIIYKDYNKTTELEKYTGSEDINQYLAQYVKDNKDKTNHIKYTFESKDGKNYYFKKFENNK